MHLADKQIKDLTLEDKQTILTAVYLNWILEDAARGFYRFAVELIQGEVNQLNLNFDAELIEEEFTECCLCGNPSYNYEALLSEALAESNNEGALKYLKFINPEPAGN